MGRDARTPRKQYIDYYTDALNKIGFKATEKIISDTTYFPTIGNEKTDPQTGFADWIQDFPNPSDFYLLLDANSIQPTNNQNFGKVNDPKIQSELEALNKVPGDEAERPPRTAGRRWTSTRPQKAYVSSTAPSRCRSSSGNKINTDCGGLPPHLLQRSDVDRPEVETKRR